MNASRDEGPLAAEDWQELCAVDELPDDGTGRSFELGSLYVAAFRVGADVHVIADSCPHAGASLGMGVLSRGEVTCPAHALHFDLCTGQSSDGAGERVRVWPVRVQAGRVFVQTRVAAN